MIPTHSHGAAPKPRKGASSAAIGSQSFWIFPATIWMSLFFLVPLALVVVVSFCTRGPHGGVVFELTTANFFRAFDPLYLRIYGMSIQFALFTTVLCLLIGFPTAWMMATASATWRRGAVALVMVPFLTNFIIRAYGIKILLGRHGPLNRIMMLTGIVTEPVSMTDSSMAVWFGMVTNYLPFMILPLFTALERFDFRLLEAAADLGARGTTAFVKIVVPLLARPAIAGMTLVFIPAFGEFIIPDFLGGARQMLIGNLLTEQFLKARDWPFGSAIAMVMFAVVFLLGGLLALIGHQSRRGKGRKAHAVALPHGGAF